MDTKIAIVTGGSRGLGRDMALSLAKKGIDVILTYQKNENLALEVIAEIENMDGNAAALKLDMSNPASLDAFVTEVKALLLTKWDADHFDYLVNNAGMGATVAFKDVTEELFNDFLNVHFKSVFFLTQKLSPLINNGGRIVNVSSGTTRFCVPGYSVYASFKSAIETFTKYLAKELGVKNITANVIAPGPIETDFNNASIRNNPQMKAGLSSMSPLGRVGNANDIGSVVAFLCSDEARWINGQRIEVSGGINV